MFQVEHAGLVSYRFIPPVNALGSHTDPDPDRRNIGNNCFCRAEAGFDCYKSGVMNMAPCKGYCSFIDALEALKA